MIQKKFIHFNKYEDFVLKRLSSDPQNKSYYTILSDGGVSDTTTGEPDIPYKSIVYIKDRHYIWTHGQLYDASGIKSKEGIDLVALSEPEVLTVFDSSTSGNEGISVLPLIDRIEASRHYYNTDPGKEIHVFSGFSIYQCESILVSKYPVSFSADNIRKAQYLDKLESEGGDYVYSFRFVPYGEEEEPIILVNCTIYE